MRRTGYSWSWGGQERPLSRELKVRRSRHACPAQRGFTAEGTAGRSTHLQLRQYFFSSFTAQYHFILTTQAVLFLIHLILSFLSLSLDQPWNSFVFPMASAFLSVQDSYTVLHNANAQFTTSGWLLGHPRREVLIASSLVCR